MFEISPVSSSFKVGDTFTMDVIIDRRSWWQRHAPLWFGGKPKPISKCETFVVTHQTGIELFGLPATPLRLPMPNVLPPKPRTGIDQ